MTVLLPLFACRESPPDEPPDPPASCTSENHSQVSSTGATSITSAGCGTLELGNFRVLGEGTFSIDLFSDGERVIPHVVAETDGSVFRGLHMSGTFSIDGAEPPVLWSQGSSIADLPDAVLVDDDGVPSVWFAWSSWAGLVGRPDGASALVGVHSAVVTQFGVTFAEDGTVHALWGGQGEELPLAAGGELFLDALFLGMGPDPIELWETWVAAVAANAGIVPPPAPPPLGFSIQIQPGQPALDDLRDALDAIAALQDDPAVVAPAVVLVEGWEASLDRTADMAAEISAAGLLPAIRIVPFLVPPSDPLVAAHPDWWVTDHAGVPIYPYDLALDITRPDAAAAVSELVQRLVAEGWQILVLDRLDAAAVEGVRSVPTTGTLAYRTALEIVRAAAGDAWITAMDAPLLPSAGLVDGYRIAGGLSGVFTGGVWWWIDNGQVPAERSLFEPNPLTGESVAAALMGGTWQVASLTGDVDLTLSPDLHALSATSARPLEPLATLGTHQLWQFGSGEIALMNWSLTPATVAGPGGQELLTGEIAEPGDRVLQPGAGEVWITGTP